MMLSWNNIIHIQIMPSLFSMTGMMIPAKASDNERLWESEEVFEYIICAVCPMTGEYEPGKPECGFLFPAFTDRSGDLNHIAVFQADTGHPHDEILEVLGLSAGV